MARKLRVQYPGAIYHVMNRGDHSESVFRDSRDPELFLATLAEACGKTDWQIHSFCLVSNHFHLVVETPRANLVPGMKWLMSTYTSRFNRKHRLFGHLFSGRYKACPWTAAAPATSSRPVITFIINPARAHLLTPAQALEAYPWSSYPLYLKAPTQRPAWLRTDRLLGEWGIPMDTPAGREHFAASLEARRRSEQPEELEDPPSHGWCLGSERFRQELLQQMSALPDHNYAGPEWRETTEKKAQRILAEELKQRAWTSVELACRRKGDLEKIKIAFRLRTETTMTWAWIAQNLSMGAPGSVANCLRAHQ